MRAAFLVHDRSAAPRFALASVMLVPLRVCAGGILVVRRQRFNLLLRRVDRKIFGVPRVWTNAVHRHQKFLTAQPAAGVHHRVLNRALA